MTNDYETLLLSRRGAVTTVTLNRPDRRNAMSFQMLDEIAHCMQALGPDPDTDVIVFAGAGDSFSAGGDMEDILRMLEDGDFGRVKDDGLAPIAACRKPTIAAVHGYAYGGGALLAISCDLRICSETARFRFPGTAYGLVAGAARLPVIIGAPLAKELIFTGRSVEAAEAVHIGLANRIVSPHRLASEVQQLAEDIAAQSQAAVIASKNVIEITTNVLAAEKAERDFSEQLRRSDDHKERFKRAAGRVLGLSNDDPS